MTDTHTHTQNPVSAAELPLFFSRRDYFFIGGHPPSHPTTTGVIKSPGLTNTLLNEVSFKPFATWNLIFPFGVQPFDINTVNKMFSVI